MLIITFWKFLKLGDFHVPLSSSLPLQQGFYIIVIIIRWRVFVEVLIEYKRETYSDMSLEKCKGNAVLLNLPGVRI